MERKINQQLAKMESDFQSMHDGEINQIFCAVPGLFAELVKKFEHDEEMKHRFPAIWTALKSKRENSGTESQGSVHLLQQDQEVLPEKQEISENSPPAPSSDTMTTGLIEFRQDEIQEAKIGTVEVPLHFHPMTEVPAEINVFNFTDISDLTSALEHSSHCKVDDCHEVFCGRMKGSFAHLMDCQHRKFGCEACMGFLRLLSCHGQACERDPCAVLFCLSLRMQMGHEIMKARRAGRKFRKVRVGRRLIKKSEIIPCSSCLLKKIPLTP